MSNSKFYKKMSVNTFAFGALLNLEGNDVFPFLDFVKTHKSDYEKHAHRDSKGKVLYPVSLGIFDENDKDPNSKTGYQAWQDNRKIHFSGSNMGALLGLSKYDTSSEKIGEYVEANMGIPSPYKKEGEISPDIATRGHRAEPYLADRAIKHIREHLDPNAEMYFDPGIYEDPERSWISFSPDRVMYANGHFSYVEIKSHKSSSTLWTDYAKKGKIHPMYYAQLAAGMHVLNVPDAYLVAGISWDEYVVLHVVRDEEFESGMMIRLDECWSFASKGEVPPLEWGETKPEQLQKAFIRRYGTINPAEYKRKTYDVYDPDGSIRNTVVKGMELTDLIAQKEKEIKELKDQLGVVGIELNRLTENFVGSVLIKTSDDEDAEKIKFTVKSSTHRTGKFDEEAFKSEFPNEYRECFSIPEFNKKKAEEMYPHLVKRFTGEVEDHIDGTEKLTCIFKKIED